MRLTTTKKSRGDRCFLFLVALLLPEMLSGSAQPSNWVGQFAPCDQAAELAKHNHMDVGVWLNTSNAVLAAEFRRAMNFWTEVVDLTWHEEHTLNCTIQVVDGTPALFMSRNFIAARSQFVDRANFHGWIAFNPKCRLNQTDVYLAAIHEIGHMLGLSHNSNPRSVMYFLNPDAPARLDAKDMASLASRHKLRRESTIQASVLSHIAER